MSGKPTKHAELLLLCGKVRDEALTPEDAARLDRLLQSSDEAKRLYVQYMSVASILESRGAAEEQADGSAEPAGTVDHDLLAELLEQEQEAEVAVVAQPEVLRLKAGRDKQAWQLAGAWRFVVRQPAAWGAVAAAVALAVTLAVVFIGGNDGPGPIAEQPGSSSQPEPVVPDDTEANPAITPGVISGVATLTAERGAVWAEGALAPGSPLQPGGRFTLTEGSAEITTRRGAVAVLEAPTTIELLDNDNALRLVTGRLVGICETESSKGFVVRTLHMDVTDIGTRFGVDATRPDITEVHVLRGEVEVVRPAGAGEPAPEPIRVVQGQAVRAMAASADLVSIPPQYKPFTEGLAMYRLPGTAATIHRGATTDSEWRLIAVDDQRLETPVPLSIGKPVGASQVTPNLPGIARWVRVDDTEAYQGDQDAVYTIQANFIVPNHIDLDTAVLQIDFHADDRLEGVQFNSRPYAGWQQVEQTRNGKGTALIPLRDVLVTHGINGVNLNVKNIATTELYLHLAWRIESDPEPTN
ncbi:MAG: FecR domain-containing protein [Planctomycetota bacterium]